MKQVYAIIFVLVKRNSIIITYLCWRKVKVSTKMWPQRYILLFYLWIFVTNVPFYFHQSSVKLCITNDSKVSGKHGTSRYDRGSIVYDKPVGCRFSIQTYKNEMARNMINRFMGDQNSVLQHKSSDVTMFLWIFIIHYFHCACAFTCQIKWKVLKRLCNKLNKHTPSIECPNGHINPLSNRHLGHNV